MGIKEVRAGANTLILLSSYCVEIYASRCLPTTTKKLVCYTAVFTVVTQSSVSGEERCLTTLKTAVQQTTNKLEVTDQRAFLFRNQTSRSVLLNKPTTAFHGLYSYRQQLQTNQRARNRSKQLSYCKNQLLHISLSRQRKAVVIKTVIFLGSVGSSGSAVCSSADQSYPSQAQRKISIKFLVLYQCFIIVCGRVQNWENDNTR